MPDIPGIFGGRVQAYVARQNEGKPGGCGRFHRRGRINSGLCKINTDDDDDGMRAIKAQTSLCTLVAWSASLLFAVWHV